MLSYIFNKHLKTKLIKWDLLALEDISPSAMEVADYLVMQSLQAAVSASSVEPAVTTGQPDHRLRRKWDVG